MVRYSRATNEIPNTCAGSRTTSDVGGVRSKKSGRVAVSGPDSAPARPNSASHSSRCHRCRGSSHPAIRPPFFQAASISGRE